MYIERAEMKKNAKASLRGRWGLAIGAMVLFYLIDFVITMIAQSPFAETVAYYQECIKNDIAVNINPGVMAGYYIMTIIASVVVATIAVGWISVSLKISRGEPSKVKDLFSYIPDFFKIAGLYLYVFVKTLLWTLLFIVPGIIAAINYSQAYYIMADNPDIGIVEAVEQSKRMMKGNKARYFIMSLSFIGWALLTAITCGILGFWSIPYMQVSYANFYNALLLEQGISFKKEETGFYENDTNVGEM